MESKKCRLIITNNLTHGKDAKSGWMNQEFIKLVFLTDSSKTQQTVSLNKSWTEAKCQEMDDLAQEDHTYKATKKELSRYRSHWMLQLNDLTFNGPMALRDDYKAAVSLKNHMHRRPEDYQKQSPPQYQDRQRRGCKCSETCRQGPNTG